MLGDAAARRGRAVADGSWLSGPTSSSSAPASAGWPRRSGSPRPVSGVVVLERNDVAGGKLAVRPPRRVHVRRRAVARDAAPRLRRAVPGRRHVARRRGRRCVRLDPQFRYHWPDGSSLVVPDDPAARSTRSTTFSPGAGAAWRRFDEHGRRIWDVSERTFLAGPMSGPVALLRRMRSPATCWPSTRCARCTAVAAVDFDDPRLVQWAGRYATYSGSSPYRAPATLACIPHIESRYGCWYPIGGLDALRAALAAGRRAARCRRCARASTSCAITDDGVARDRRRARRPTGRLSPRRRRQRRRRAPLRPTCCPTRARLRRVRRAPRSTSGFVVLAARPRRDARHRPPQRLVLRRRPGRVRRARGRADGRRPDDLRLRVRR